MTTPPRFVTGIRTPDRVVPPSRASITILILKSANRFSTAGAMATQTGQSFDLSFFVAVVSCLIGLSSVFRFSSLNKCLERCSPQRNHDAPQSLGEEEPHKREPGGGMSEAGQVGLGVCLSLFLLVAVALGLWFYKLYREKENYRIFQVRIISV